MTEQSTPSRWRQWAAILFGVAVVLTIWLVSQSTWAIGNRVLRAGGYLNLEPTAPDWLRNTFGEGVAVMFDTPRDLYMTGQIPAGLLEQAAEIDSLRWVVLDGTNVTDEQFAAFREHPNLRGVRLSKTAISDRTLDVLQSMPELQGASVEGCRVTPQGLAVFRKQRPDVKLEVDPATEVGLSEAVVSGRLEFLAPSLESPGALSIHGPLHPHEIAAVARLSILRLRLSRLPADADLVPILEGKSPSSIDLEAIDLSAEFAAAVAAVPVQRLSLTDMTLSAEAAAALSRLDIQSLSFSRVEFAPGAAAALAGLKSDSLTVSDGIGLAEGSRFVNVQASYFALLNVDLTGNTQAFAGVVADDVLLREVTLDAAGLTAMINIPQQHLWISHPHMTDDQTPQWQSCQAREIAISRLSLRTDEVAALTQLPLEHLELGESQLPAGIESLLANIRAKSLSLATVTPAEAQALASSSLGSLRIFESLPAETAREFAAATQIEDLMLTIEGATVADVSKLVALPRIESLNLTLRSPAADHEQFRHELLAIRPDLRLFDGVMWLNVGLGRFDVPYSAARQLGPAPSDDAGRNHPTDATDLRSQNVGGT